jgi:hypothetical protein
MVVEYAWVKTASILLSVHEKGFIKPRRLVRMKCDAVKRKSIQTWS